MAKAISTQVQYLLDQRCLLKKHLLCKEEKSTTIGRVTWRCEVVPILSAAVSTTESSSRKLSRFTISHFEALRRVTPPLYSEGELMNE